MAILSAGTELLYNRGERNSGRPIALSDLYSKYYGAPCRTRPWEAPGDTRLHSYVEATERVAFAPLEAIYRLGTQDMVSIWLEGTTQPINIGASAYLLGRRGLFPAAGAQPGVRVLCKGTMRPVGGVGRRPRDAQGRVIIGSLKYYSGGAPDNTRDPNTGVLYLYRRSYKARLVIEAEMNGLPLDHYIMRLRHDPSALVLPRLPDDVDVHHVDHNCTNDLRSNLSVVTREQHARLHNCDERRFAIDYKRMLPIAEVRITRKAGFDVRIANRSNVAAGAGLIVFN